MLLPCNTTLSSDQTIAAVLNIIKNRMSYLDDQLVFINPNEKDHQEQNSVLAHFSHLLFLKILEEIR